MRDTFNHANFKQARDVLEICIFQVELIFISPHPQRSLRLPSSWVLSVLLMALPPPIPPYNLTVIAVTFHFLLNI